MELLYKQPVNMAKQTQSNMVTLLDIHNNFKIRVAFVFVNYLSSLKRIFYNEIIKISDKE